MSWSTEPYTNPAWDTSGEEAKFNSTDSGKAVELGRGAAFEFDVPKLVPGGDVPQLRYGDVLAPKEITSEGLPNFENPAPEPEPTQSTLPETPEPTDVPAAIESGTNVSGGVLTETPPTDEHAVSHVAPLRFGQGSSPSSLRIRRTVLLLIERILSFFNSPTIRA